MTETLFEQCDPFARGCFCSVQISVQTVEHYIVLDNSIFFKLLQFQSKLFNYFNYKLEQRNNNIYMSHIFSHTAWSRPRLDSPGDMRVSSKFYHPPANIVKAKNSISSSRHIGGLRAPRLRGVGHDTRRGASLPGAGRG